jgi:hypothetical protein
MRIRMAIEGVVPGQARRKNENPREIKAFRASTSSEYGTRRQEVGAKITRKSARRPLHLPRCAKRPFHGLAAVSALRASPGAQKWRSSATFAALEGLARGKARAWKGASRAAGKWRKSATLALSELRGRATQCPTRPIRRSINCEADIGQARIVKPFDSFVCSLPQAPLSCAWVTSALLRSAKVRSTPLRFASHYPTSNWPL